MVMSKETEAILRAQADKMTKEEVQEMLSPTPDYAKEYINGYTGNESIFTRVQGSDKKKD